MKPRPNMVPTTAPNIIYMHSHDTGRYLQPYGYAVKTPHLQRFAEEGVLLRGRSQLRRPVPLREPPC